MINQIIANIQQDLTEILTEDQLEALSQVLTKHLSTLADEKPAEKSTKQNMLPLFIAAKRVEGCSEKSLRYYESTIRNMLDAIDKPECQITTEDLRGYLDTYQRRGTVSKVTLDNVRRILSSFFAWLEDEDYIVKSPVRRIHKVKTGKTVKETYQFLLDAYTQMHSTMAEDASIYVFHADTEGLNFRRAFADAEFYLSGTCIWKKQSLVLGRSPYQWQHEPVLFGWKKAGKHQWYTGRKETTIWEFDKPKKNGDQPTMKPIPLLAYPIMNSSMANSLVLDPFGGSGSTLIACQQTGRICYTIELDEKFCDVIVKRYIEQVGSAAGVTVVRDGLTYKYEEIASA